jgi:hypothetical protein
MVLEGLKHQTSYAMQVTATNVAGEYGRPPQNASFAGAYSSLALSQVRAQQDVLLQDVQDR